MKLNYEEAQHKAIQLLRQGGGDRVQCGKTGARNLHYVGEGGNGHVRMIKLLLTVVLWTPGQQECLALLATAVLKPLKFLGIQLD